MEHVTTDSDSMLSVKVLWNRGLTILILQILNWVIKPYMPFYYHFLWFKKTILFTGYHYEHHKPNMRHKLTHYLSCLSFSHPLSLSILPSYLSILSLYIYILLCWNITEPIYPIGLLTSPSLGNFRREKNLRELHSYLCVSGMFLWKFGVEFFSSKAAQNLMV